MNVETQQTIKHSQESGIYVWRERGIFSKEQEDDLTTETG
jgi:hypothetical protein